MVRHLRHRPARVPRGPDLRPARRRTAPHHRRDRADHPRARVRRRRRGSRRGRRRSARRRPGRGRAVHHLRTLRRLPQRTLQRLRHTGIRGTVRLRRRVLPVRRGRAALDPPTRRTRHRRRRTRRTPRRGLPRRTPVRSATEPLGARVRRRADRARHHVGPARRRCRPDHRRRTRRRAEEEGRTGRRGPHHRPARRRRHRAGPRADRRTRRRRLLRMRRHRRGAEVRDPVHPGGRHVRQRRDLGPRGVRRDERSGLPRGQPARQPGLRERSSRDDRDDRLRQGRPLPVHHRPHRPRRHRRPRVRGTDLQQGGERQDPRPAVRHRPEGPGAGCRGVGIDAGIVVLARPPWVGLRDESQPDVEVDRRSIPRTRRPPPTSSPCHPAT
ncbi:exported hypothetical protein [Rhodococcus ruber]|uniref:Uncharacterized protein n=1 Tax=Rhodococcus ruber TaxID=1830 RepID=A0A098BT82_9NOCA|nr:exported hypothetical protein [Rhodococcus ruber]